MENEAFGQIERAEQARLDRAILEGLAQAFQLLDS